MADRPCSRCGATFRAGSPLEHLCDDCYFGPQTVEPEPKDPAHTQHPRTDGT